MKKFLLFASMAVVMTSCFGQEKKPASPRETVSSDQVSVSYGRPSKKGRVIFGELEKYGKVWRTGANEATEITFKKDGMFGGKAVKAGTYTLFTVPEKSEWTVILNSELKQWGAYNYDKIKDNNVLEVKVPAQATADVTEQLTISLSSNIMTIAWDQTKVEVPLKF